MSNVSIKYSEACKDWAKELVKENEVVNKDSEIANSILGENPESDFDLAIARLVLQESRKK